MVSWLDLILTMTLALTDHDPAVFEAVACYYCGDTACTELVRAQDDLTGKPGNFRFVTCKKCGLAYQTPRIRTRADSASGTTANTSRIARRPTGGRSPGSTTARWRSTTATRTAWSRAIIKLGPDSQVLDVGCGAGTFLARMVERYRSQASGVDFKDLSHLPSFQQFRFHRGLFYEQELAENAFDLVTMWHFLEHDYDPLRTLADGAPHSQARRAADHRSAAAG